MTLHHFLLARINNQYSHPVYTGRHTQQSTIHRKYHGKTSYLLRNVDVGIREFAGTGYHVDDVQTTWTDESQMMTSRWSHTSQSHKSIAQMNRTKLSCKTR